MSSPVSARMGFGAFPINRPLPTRAHCNDEQTPPPTFAGTSARFTAQDAVQLSRKPRVAFQGLGDLTPDEGVDALTEVLQKDQTLAMVQKFSQMAVYLRDVRPDLAESEKWGHMDKFLLAFPGLREQERQAYTASFRIVSLKRGSQEVTANV